MKMTGLQEVPFGINLHVFSPIRLDEKASTGHQGFEFAYRDGKQHGSWARWFPDGRLNFAENLLAGGGKPTVAGIGPVDLQHVATGDLRLAVVGRQQLLDVDTVRSATDLLHERIDPHVVGLRDLGSTAIEEIQTMLPDF